MMSNDYHDYVIKDGKLVGKFEEMYQKCDDPWDRVKLSGNSQTDWLLHRACSVVVAESDACRAIDLGCGIGQSVRAIIPVADLVAGVDISKTAIARASEALPDHTFAVGDLRTFMAGADDCGKIDLDQFNTLILCHLTWYILDDLAEFRAWLAENWAGRYLVHVLAVYAPGVQKHGTDMFTDHTGILQWFACDYLEHGQMIQTVDGRNLELSYFLARVPGSGET
ncbi:MAG: methyltransferase domain-containing protein [Alphaproteobacteria bacterium]